MTTVVEELLPVPDPEQVCERLSGLPYRLWLDSATVTSRLGQFSFVTADPELVVRGRDRAVEIVDRRGESRHHEGDALAAVRDILAPFAQTRLDGLPPFQGGAAGYIAYDWGRVLERLPSPRYDDIGLDDVALGIYDWVIAWDHAARRAWLISTGIPELATQILGRPVRIGRPLGFGRLPNEAKSASFAVPSGLLVYPQYAHLEHVEPRHTRQLRTGTDGYFGKVGRWLREGF